MSRETGAVHRLRLRAGRYREKAAKHPRELVRNPTDPEPNHVRENSFESVTYAQRL